MTSIYTLHSFSADIHAFTLQEYQAYTSQAEQGGSPQKARDYQQSGPHSLLPQGRGSIVYDTSAFGAYQQQGPSTFATQSYSQVCFM